MRGPGCFDMKAGLAMAFHALAGLDDRDGVTLLVTGDEEIGSPTSRALIEEEARQASRRAGARGLGRRRRAQDRPQGRLRCTTCACSAGPRTPASSPSGASTPALELAHQVLVVAALADPARGTTVTPTRDAAPAPRPTPCPPTARSPSTSASGPSPSRSGSTPRCASLRTGRCREPSLEVDGRPQPAAAGGGGVGGAVRAGARARRSGSVCPSRSAAAVGGGSDGNFTAGVGTPTLDGLGAVGGGAHADDEHVLVDALPGRTALLAALGRGPAGATRRHTLETTGAHRP